MSDDFEFALVRPSERTFSPELFFSSAKTMGKVHISLCIVSIKKASRSNNLESMEQNQSGKREEGHIYYT